MTTDLRLSGPAPLRGRLLLAGDKSLSHRALLFAAMANGRSRITNLGGGADVAHTLAALRLLGTAIDGDASNLTVDGHGVDGLSEPVSVLDCGNSGTSIRTLAGLLAGRPFLSVLEGDASLARRPMARVVEPLRAMGATIDGRDGGRFAPLVVRGGSLRGCAHTLAVASAQVKTALVLAGLQAEGTTEIVEPAPSRDHTERMLGALGAPVTRTGPCTVRVTRGAPASFELDVPGDPSSAAFWVVAALVTPGSDVVLEGVCVNPTRVAFVDVLRRMGARVEVDVTGEQLGEPVGDLHVVSGPLHGATIGGEEIPLVQDEIPVLAVAAAFADGDTEIRDAAELRVKESDRIATVEELLRGIGVGVESGPDSLTVRGGGAPRPGRLAGHGDHRLAMAAAVAANAIRGESVVEGWDVVAVSYPGFADDLARLSSQ